MICPGGQIGICISVWTVVLRPDAVRVLAPRTCEGGGEAGGSPSTTYLSQKGAKNPYSKHRKRILFGALLSGIHTSPIPVCALVSPPSQVRGARMAAPPVRQMPICRAEPIPCKKCCPFKNRTGSMNIEIYKICGRLSPAATNVSGEDYWFFTRSFSLMKNQVRTKPPIRETHQQPA